MDAKLFDNITEIVRDDMRVTITKGSKVSIAAACFSIYAYRELKKQLERVRGAKCPLRRPASPSMPTGN